MKKFLFFTMVALFMMALCSCSKDDGNSLAGDKNDDLSGLSSETEEQSDSINDDVSAIYHILDKDGQEVNVINYGDEFIFEVIVTNSTDQILKFKDVWYLLNGAYIVYNSEGQMFNPIPNNDLMMRPVTIEPGEQFRNGLIWPWVSVPLTKGKYYSTYTLNIDKMINKSYTITFEIK